MLEKDGWVNVFPYTSVKKFYASDLKKSLSSSAYQFYIFSTSTIRTIILFPPLG